MYVDCLLFCIQLWLTCIPGALKIEDIITKKEDRSTYMKFDAQVDSDTQGEYKAEC